MSRGDLQEMEVGTKQSRTAVNAGAKAGDPMPKLAAGAVAGQTGGWEDLGGPDPTNYRPDDDSAKLKTPGGTLSQVKNVVNKGAKSADAMKSLKKEDADYDEDEELLEDSEEYDEEEVISEEESEDEGSAADKKEDKKEKEGKKEDKKEDKDKEDKDDEDDMKEEFDIEEDVKHFFVISNL